MNGWEISALVFFYGMTVIGLVGLPRILHRTFEMKAENASAVTFINLLFVVATVIVWANHDPRNILLTVVATVLLMIFASQIIRAFIHIGKTLIGSKRGVVQRAIELLVCAILISVLAFA